MGCVKSYCHFKMKMIVRLFPYGMCVARVTSLWTPPLPEPGGAPPRPLLMVWPGAGRRGDLGGDPCSLFQTQAAQAVLQSREGAGMPSMAVLLGLMGIGMSGYSSRQLTLHCKPSSHLFRWWSWGKKYVHTYKGRLAFNQVSPKGVPLAATESN